MKAYRGVLGQLHSFFTSKLEGDERLTLRPGRFIHWKEHRYLLNRKPAEPPGFEPQAVHYAMNKLCKISLMTQVSLTDK